MEKKKKHKEAKDVKVEEVHTREVVREESNKVVKKDHSLFKVLLIAFLVIVVLTWIIPSGTFNGAEYTKADLVRTGINEVFLSVFYGANYYLLHVFFLFAVGIFYSVISKTNGYTKMIKKIAKLFKNREKLFVLLVSLIITLMSSMFTQVFVPVIFIPMIYSVAKELKLNKITTVLMTFGALMAGLIGSTFTTYGTEYMYNYMNVAYTDGLVVRFAILALSYLLLNVFIIINNKKNKHNEETNEIFVASGQDKGKSWPYFLIFGLLFVLTILGYVGWSSVFKFDVFTNFHTWLTTEVLIAKHPIFGYILGNATAFGSWDIFTITYIMIIIVIFVKLFARIKFDEVLDRAVSGIEKMLKPVMLITFAYALFVISYWSGITNTIVNWLNNTSNFNPYLNALGNAIASALHVDFGFTGFSFSSFYAAKWADNTKAILTIMTSMNGLMSLVAPTSIYMLVGLSLSDISYKKWIKAIWKYFVAMLVVLMIIFTLITYL